MALWGSKRSDLQARIDDIQSGVTAVADLLGDRASAAGQSAHEAADRIGPLLNDITDQIDTALTAAKREGRHAYKAVETKAGEHPMVAAAAVAGVGLLIGSLLLSWSKRANAPAAARTSAPAKRRPKAASRRRGGGRSRKTA